MRAVERGGGRHRLCGRLPSARCSSRAPDTVRRASCTPNPLLADDYFFLNTRGAAVRRRRVRQAVNYAVDRNRMVELTAVPPRCTAELPGAAAELRRLPALLPLHDRAEPRRELHGPDLAKARQARRGVGHERTDGERLDRREAFVPSKAGPTSSPCSRPLGYKPQTQVPLVTQLPDPSRMRLAAEDPGRRGGSWVAGLGLSVELLLRRFSAAAPSRWDGDNRPSSATRGSTPRSPASARSRPATLRRPASSGARSTATSSTRLPGSSPTTPRRRLRLAPGRQLPVGARSGARSSTRCGCAEKHGQHIDVTVCPGSLDPLSPFSIAPGRSAAGPPSTSGPGRGPFKAVARVRIPLGASCRGSYRYTETA